jgi:CRISPR/Cas system endoribonuclease Cas6 (RAMP superfamily)
MLDEPYIWGEAGGGEQVALPPRVAMFMGRLNNSLKKRFSAFKLCIIEPNKWKINKQL